MKYSDLLKTYGLGCKNKSCWLTYWKELAPEELETHRCPRCNSEVEVLYG